MARSKHGASAWIALIGIALVLSGIAWWLRIGRGSPADAGVGIPAIPGIQSLDPQVGRHLGRLLRDVEQRPEEASRHVEFGLAFAANSLWEPARRCFQNAVVLDSSEPLAHLWVGVASDELGEVDDALRRYVEVTTRFPKFPTGWNRLGDLLLRLGNDDEAENALRRLIALRPSDWRGLAGVGQALLTRGDHAGAIEWLDKAVSAAPTERLPHHLLGLALARSGRVDEGSPHLAAGIGAVRSHPIDDWSARVPTHLKQLAQQYRLATALAQEGRRDEAIALLEEALETHPKDSDLLASLGRACCEGGKPQRGLALLEEAVRLAPRRPEHRVNLASCLLGMGREGEALVEVDRATIDALDLAVVHRARGQVLAALGRTPEAEVEANRALELSPTDPAVLLFSGSLLERRGASATAFKRYQAAAAKDPLSIAAWSGVIRSARAAGREDVVERAIATARAVLRQGAGLSSLERMAAPGHAP